MRDVRLRAIRWMVPLLVATLSAASACGGDGPTEPASTVAGLWQGEHGSILSLSANGESVTGTLRGVLAAGQEAGPEVAVCGTFRSPTLALATANCASGQVGIIFDATLEPSGRALTSQWKTNGGYGDFFLVNERFARLP